MSLTCYLFLGIKMANKQLKSTLSWQYLYFESMLRVVGVGFGSVSAFDSVAEIYYFTFWGQRISHFPLKQELSNYHRLRTYAEEYLSDFHYEKNIYSQHKNKF